MTKLSEEKKEWEKQRRQIALQLTAKADAMATEQVIRQMLARLRPADRYSFLLMSLLEIDPGLAENVSSREKIEVLRRVHGAVGDCKVPDCSVCSVLACPNAEPLHFHGDGCPACHPPDERETPPKQESKSA